MSGWYPFNPNLGQVMQTGVDGVSVDQGYIAHFQVSAADAIAASTTGVHAAIACSTSVTTVTTGFTNPGCPKNVSATAGGTAGDIKAVQVVVAGTNFADEVISETLPVFTVDTAGTVVGSKAFKTVTGVTIPAMDGAGATVSIGFGEKLGLPFKLAHNTVLAAYLNNTKEGTAPTVTTSTAAVDGNTIDLNSTLDGHVVDAYLIV